jgi:hypothetical protein
MGCTQAMHVAFLASQPPPPPPPLTHLQPPHPPPLTHQTTSTHTPNHPHPTQPAPPPHLHPPLPTQHHLPPPQCPARDAKGGGTPRTSPSLPLQQARPRHLLTWEALEAGPAMRPRPSAKGYPPYPPRMSAASTKGDGSAEMLRACACVCARVSCVRMNVRACKPFRSRTVGAQVVHEPGVLARRAQHRVKHPGARGHVLVPLHAYKGLAGQQGGWNGGWYRRAAGGGRCSGGTQTQTQHHTSQRVEDGHSPTVSTERSTRKGVLTERDRRRQRCGRGPGERKKGLGGGGHRWAVGGEAGVCV